MSSHSPETSPSDHHWLLLADAVPLILREAVSMLRDPHTLALAERRFREGQETFGDAWLTRDLDWFYREAREEAADHLLYLAMRRVREHISTAEA